MAYCTMKPASRELIKAHQQHLYFRKILQSTSDLTSFWTFSVNGQPGHSEALKASCQNKSRSKKPAPFLPRNLAINVRPDHLLRSFTQRSASTCRSTVGKLSKGVAVVKAKIKSHIQPRQQTSVQIRLASWTVKQPYVRTPINNNQSSAYQDEVKQDLDATKPSSSILLPVGTSKRRPVLS